MVLRYFFRKEIELILAKHNARILNSFQLQGNPNLPLIAYDERVCLIPAMEIATQETLEDLGRRGTGTLHVYKLKK